VYLLWFNTTFDSFGNYQLFLVLNFKLFRGSVKRLPLCLSLGKALENVSEVIGYHLVNLLYFLRRKLFTVFDIVSYWTLGIFDVESFYVES
jgi:hypothetical protein